MIRFTLHLSEELYRQLKTAAEREGISMSAVVRRALQRELLPSQEELRRQARRVVERCASGAFSGAEPDLSVNHDRYFAEAIAEEHGIK